MKIEHIAINVQNPQEMAAWWSENLGLTIIRADQTPPYITFLADEGNRSMLELYANPAGEFPDYPSMSKLTFHIAFRVDDIEVESQRLIKAGATQEGAIGVQPNGDRLGFVRDPWGVVIQLAERVAPLG